MANLDCLDSQKSTKASKDTAATAATGSTNDEAQRRSGHRSLRPSAAAAMRSPGYSSRRSKTMRYKRMERPNQGKTMVGWRRRHRSRAASACPRPCWPPPPPMVALQHQSQREIAMERRRCLWNAHGVRSSRPSPVAACWRRKASTARRLPPRRARSPRPNRSSGLASQDDPEKRPRRQRLPAHATHYQSQRRPQLAPRTPSRRP